MLSSGITVPLIKHRAGRHGITAKRPVPTTVTGMLSRTRHIQHNGHSLRADPALYRADREAPRFRGTFTAPLTEIGTVSTRSWGAGEQAPNFLREDCRLEVLFQECSQPPANSFSIGVGVIGHVTCNFGLTPLRVTFPPLCGSNNPFPISID